jgi:hypothetical protein
MDNVRQECPVSHIKDPQSFSTEIQGLQAFLSNCTNSNTFETETIQRTASTSSTPPIYLPEAQQAESPISNLLRFLEPPSFTDVQGLDFLPSAVEMSQTLPSGASKRQRTVQRTNIPEKRIRVESPEDSSQQLMGHPDLVNPEATVCDAEVRSIEKGDDRHIFEPDSAKRHQELPDWLLDSE